MVIEEIFTWLLSLFYPDPAQESVSINFNENLGDVQIRIYDLPGSIVNQFKKVNGTFFVFSYEGLSAGVYSAQITQNYNCKKVIRFIVERKAPCSAIASRCLRTLTLRSR